MGDAGYSVYINYPVGQSVERPVFTEIMLR